MLEDIVVRDKLPDAQAASESGSRGKMIFPTPQRAAWEDVSLWPYRLAARDEIAIDCLQHRGRFITITDASLIPPYMPAIKPAPGGAA